MPQHKSIFWKQKVEESWRGQRVPVQPGTGAHTGGGAIIIPLHLQAWPVTAPAVTQTQNYTARPRLYVSSLVKSPLWLPQSEYAICSLSEPRLKGDPGDLGTWELPSWSSLGLSGQVPAPYWPSRRGSNQMPPVTFVSDCFGANSLPFFSLSHPSSDTVTSSEFRLLKVTLLDLTDPPFLVPWVTCATTLPTGLMLCLAVQQLFWQDFCSHE